MATINYFFQVLFYIILAILPSVIWLLFYLRKDVHPEPNSMVIKTFLLGAFIALPAAFTELLVKTPFSFFEENPFTIFLYFLFGVALIEETAKYLVVRWSVLKSPEMDEPADLILYMIISALGFAALENVMYILDCLNNPKCSFFNFVFPFPLNNFLNLNIILSIFFLNLIRSFGAVLSHALWSGTFGYFLALSFYHKKNRKILFFSGLIVVVFLHALFNFVFYLTSENFNNFNLFLISIPAIMNIVLVFFIYFGFKRLQKMKSICKI